jgi:hypothetical protein
MSFFSHPPDAFAALVTRWQGLSAAEFGDEVLAELQSLMAPNHAPQVSDWQRLVKVWPLVEAHLKAAAGSVRHSGQLDQASGFPARIVAHVVGSAFAAAWQQGRATVPKIEWPGFAVAAVSAIGHQIRWAAYSGDAQAKQGWQAFYSLFGDIELAMRQSGLTLPGLRRGELEQRVGRSLLVATLNTGALNARQLAKVADWLEEWGEAGRIDTRLDETLDDKRHYYGIDLGSDIGPQRIAQLVGVGAGAKARYVRTHGLLAAITEERAALFQETAIATLGEYAQNPLFEYSEALDHLHRFWTFVANRATARATDRERLADIKVEAIAGFGNLARWAASAVGLPTASPKPVVDGLAAAGDTPARHWETWGCVDRSASGMGVSVPVTSRFAPERGMLIAVYDGKTGLCSLGGLVRYQASASSKVRSGGVQLLSSDMRPVRFLSPDAALLAEDPADDPMVGFYVFGDPARGVPDSLVIGIGRFDPKANYAIFTEQALYQIKMNRVIQQGIDWERVGFEVITRVKP